MADNRTKHLDIRFTPGGLETFNAAFSVSIYKTKEDFLLSLCQANGIPPADIAEVEAPKSKENVIHIRILAEQKKQILNLFKSSSEKSLGVFLYKAVKKVPIEVTEIKVSNREIQNEIRKIGVNLNQISAKVNQRVAVDLEVLELLKDIKKELLILSKKTNT